MHEPNALKRVQDFCQQFELRIPVLMAPMAGACPPSLAIAVSNAGGLGACGTLLMDSNAIDDWVGEVRSQTNGAFQLNTWIPDPEPKRDAQHERDVRSFLNQWGPAVAGDAADIQPIDFNEQCKAMIRANPRVISSIMGLYPPEIVQQLKAEHIAWFATVTTVKEALAAQAAGADVIIAQGMEAGGHRGTFDAEQAHTNLVGLFSLLPSVVDAVEVPVVATGGIANARQVAAAITLGASAVQIGTGLLRSPEAKLNPAWSEAIANAKPEDTVPTRAFSGRLGRSIRSPYVEAAARSDTPEPAPFPIQRNLTNSMRVKAAEDKNIDCLQAWAGQSSAYAKNDSATDIVETLWLEAKGLLPA